MSDSLENLRINVSFMRCDYFNPPKKTQAPSKPSTTAMTYLYIFGHSYIRRLGDFTTSYNLKLAQNLFIVDFRAKSRFTFPRLAHGAYVFNFTNQPLHYLLCMLMFTCKVVWVDLCLRSRLIINFLWVFFILHAKSWKVIPQMFFEQRKWLVLTNFWLNCIHKLRIRILKK